MAYGLPIKVTSDDFVSATEWEGSNLDNVFIFPRFKLKVFLNDVGRFLQEGDEWVRTQNGMQILIPTFDATVANYTFYITLSI